MAGMNISIRSGTLRITFTPARAAYNNHIGADSLSSCGHLASPPSLLATTQPHPPQHNNPTTQAYAAAAMLLRRHLPCFFSFSKGRMFLMKTSDSSGTLRTMQTAARPACKHSTHLTPDPQQTQAQYKTYSSAESLPSKCHTKSRHNVQVTISPGFLKFKIFGHKLLGSNIIDSKTGLFCPKVTLNIYIYIFFFTLR